MQYYNADSNEYIVQRKWATKFDQQVMLLAYMGLYGSRLATEFEDTKQCIDGVINVKKNGLIAFRIRSYSHYKKFPFEFTIRSRSRSGLETEYDKILSGFGNAMIYGFSSQNEKYVQDAYLIDLDVFRNIVKNKIVDLQTQTNVDGTQFFAYKYNKFPPELIIRRFNVIKENWILNMFVFNNLLDITDIPEKRQESTQISRVFDRVKEIIQPNVNQPVKQQLLF